MKQIKTITCRLDDSEEFDAAVNEALAEGWTLTERKVLQPVAQPSGSVYFHNMLYAELERHIITEDEKNCDNCKHSNCPIHKEPCLSCGENADKWEAEA